MKKLSKKIAKKGKQQRKEQIQQDQHEDVELDPFQIQDIQDDQYKSLLKDTNHRPNQKKNSYFLTNQKYASSKAQQQPSQPSQMQDNDLPQQNGFVQAFKAYKQQTIKQSKLLHEDIKRLNQEDQQFETLRKQTKSSDQTFRDAIGLRDQLQLERLLIDFRYNEQNNIEAIKKFPTDNFPQNDNLHEMNQELQGKLLNNLSLLLKTYKSISSTSFPDKKPQDLMEQQATSDNISNAYSKFNNEVHLIQKATEDGIIKWSQKTNLLSISQSKYNSLVMQTPIGQAKKILSDWQRVSHKSQQKRGTFKILFRQEENIRTSSDPQIYDDFQLFAQLEKHFVAEINDEKEFRVDDTLRYLRSREPRGHKEKEVDRKASKNRKIRYQIHPKLLNFMPSFPLNVIQSRDQIVANIFNCKPQGENVIQNQQQTYYIDM